MLVGKERETKGSQPITTGDLRATSHRQGANFTKTDNKHQTTNESEPSSSSNGKKSHDRGMKWALSRERSVCVLKAPEIIPYSYPNPDREWKQRHTIQQTTSRNRSEKNPERREMRGEKRSGGR